MKIEKFNETLGGLIWKYNQLKKKKSKTQPELDEFSEIDTFLNLLSIERKKNKKGEYEYFIADNCGKVVRKLKDYFNGMQYEYFWAFSHYKTTQEEEHDEKIVVDSGWGGEDSYVKDITVKTGGEEKEVKVLLNNYGEVIFDGIKEIHKYYIDFNYEDYGYEEENVFLIVSIEPDFHKDLITEHFDYFSYDKDKPVYCVISSEGKHLIKPTQYGSIFFDSKKKIFFNNKGDELGKI
jgi:hypothetical protein